MTSMEDLLQTQEQISVAIEQLYSNFKKDSAERKNNDYIKRRLMTLDGYWQEYQSNHIKLCGLGDKSHSYFTSNQYEISKDRFANIKSAIQHFEPLIKETLPPLIRPATPLGVPKGQHDQQSTGQAHQGSSSKTDELLKKQSSNFKAFEHTITNIMLDTVSEKWEFDHLLRILNARWSAIDSLHWELDNELGGRDPSYETAFFKYEQAYNDVIKSINKKMWSISHRNQSTPQIEIPTFSGGYHQWNSFKDLFTETIHSNPSLSSAQKMQFLKSKVKGESERLIQHLPISSDNYSICWDILNHRFDNKKLILNSHIDIMLSIPVASQPSYSHIKRIHDYLLESLNAIKNLGIEVDSWDPLLIYLMCQKLDSDTHKEYVVSVKNPREVPKLQEFLSFLENKFTTIESTRCKQEQIFKKPIIRNGNQNHQSFFGSKYPKSNNYNSKQLFQNNGRAISQSLPRKYVYVAKMFKCPICETDDHGLFHCKQFINMLQPLKGDTVVKYKLCQNCLYCHHGKACISEKRCRECNQAHNTLLHGAFEKLEPPAGAMNSNNMRDVSKYEYPQAGRSNSHVSLQRDIPEILLATAQVKVQKTDGTYIILRALLDQGSQASLITENAAQLLGLPRQRCHGIISGVGIKESNCKGTIHIKCSAINNDFEFETDTLIMKNLIRNLPSYSFIKPTWSYLDNITLADPEFNHSKPVDLLLGADIYSLILLEGICRSDQNSPVAQNTRLGWILSGNIKTLHCNVVLTNLKEIHKFWEIEDITEKSNLSTEDEQCVQYYKDKTTRREDGRYEVRLPLKSNFKENLGKSKAKAIAQFQSLERKFRKNESMQNDYTSFMKEYQSLGHMVPAANTTTPDCYLTHHGVERAESSSTKFRVVPI